jgi:hypothetical protein
MRRAFIFFFLIILLLNSCDDGSYDYGLDRYYEEIVTVVESNVFLLDDGKTLFSTTGISKKIEEGERLLLHYTLLNNQTGSYDYTVRINGYASVTAGSLKALPQEDIISLKDDPVLFESLWIGSHFLNMQFYFNFHSETHSVGLVVDKLLLDADPIEIRFKHDTNNDLVGFPVHMYLSFDLKNVLGEPQQDKRIRIFVNTSNYGKRAYDLIY